MSHSRNPGFDGGNHWVVCDVCGMDFRSSEVRQRWDGAVVCDADYETRHQQDYVRTHADVIAAQGPVRQQPEDVFTNGICQTRSAVAGQAIAGCAIAGMKVYTTMPAGTFSGSGL